MLNYVVAPMKSSVGKAFIIEHHYSHGCHNGPMCYGLYDDSRLIGVIAFATPCSENVRRSVFGPEHVNRVTELHRLVILDETPKNAESYFIARALRNLKLGRPHLWGILSFADATQGHIGVIYQATNAIYTGSSSRARFFRDQNGRLRHPRQNGHNISLADARERGWTSEMREAKHRYLFLMPDDRGHLKALKKLCRLNSLPYPKREQ